MENKSITEPNYRKRVLISAYSCQPGRGSEPGIGWNWAKQAARFNEVWVLTRADKILTRADQGLTRDKNLEVIEAEMLRHPDSALHFIYVDLPRWVSSWQRSEGGKYFYYYFWQIAAYQRARELHQEIGFDVIHHLTFGNVWLPTFLWKLPVPFIWGPLGGYESVPRSFWKLFAFKWKLFEMVRYLIQIWSRYLDPVTRMAGKKASFILGRTKATSTLLSHNYPDKIMRIQEFGINKIDLEHSIETRKNSFRNNNINVLMVGRLIHWKGFSIGIAAFQKLAATSPEAKLHIIGSGIEEKNLKCLASTLGIADKVIFHGQLPRQEVFIHYKHADIFLHPSLKDGAATVIFEAMETGLPVVCFDYAGPGEVVTESSGIKIPAKNPKQAIEGFAAALIRLANDRTLRQSLGQGARERLGDFTWEKKGDFINELYIKAIGS